VIFGKNWVQKIGQNLGKTWAKIGPKNRANMGPKNREIFRYKIIVGLIN
jgi:hypothetical protein